MPKIFIVLFLISLLYNRTVPRPKNKHSLLSQKQAPLQKHDVNSAIDTIIYPFSDKTYTVLFKILNPYESVGNTSINSILIFKHKTIVGSKTLLRCSLACPVFDIERTDFNNNGVKDLLIFHYDGARANPRYYLFLLDSINHRLITVKNFEKLPNPDIDRRNKIITSTALYGSKDYINFYKISRYNTLINLGHGFEGDARYEGDKSDSARYAKAIKAMKREHKL